MAIIFSDYDTWTIRLHTMEQKFKTKSSKLIKLVETFLGQEFETETEIEFSNSQTLV